MVSMRAKKRNNIIISLIVGVVLVVAGIVMMTNTDVDCGTGQSMKPGDICEETRRGRTTSYTYDERRGYWTRMGGIAIAGGVVFVGIGGWQITRARRRREATLQADGIASHGQQS